MIVLIVALVLASAAFQLRDEDDGFSAREAEIAALAVDALPAVACDAGQT